MWQHLKIPLAVFVLCLGRTDTFPQTSKASAGTGAPEFQLRIVPERETYSVGEGVFAKVVFTNVSGKTLCMPPPALESEVVGTGFVTIQASELTGKENEYEVWIDHYDGGPTWPRAKLLLDIKQSWIKLAPNEVWVSRRTEINLAKDVPGRWRLATTYHPPTSSFGSPAKIRRYFDTTAQMAGCTVPRLDVSAAPATIQIGRLSDDR